MPEVNRPRALPRFLPGIVGGILFGLLVERRRLGTLAHQFQNLDGRVVVVNHVALGRLPDQLLEDRFGVFGLGVNDVPLGRGRQGNAPDSLAGPPGD